MSMNVAIDYNVLNNMLTPANTAVDGQIEELLGAARAKKVCLHIAEVWAVEATMGIEDAHTMGKSDGQIASFLENDRKKAGLVKQHDIRLLLYPLPRLSGSEPDGSDVSNYSRLGLTFRLVSNDPKEQARRSRLLALEKELVNALPDHRKGDVAHLASCVDARALSTAERSGELDVGEVWRDVRIDWFITFDKSLVDKIQVARRHGALQALGTLRVAGVCTLLDEIRAE